ncbi:MAG: hypothetical protein HY451_00270 [Parcubacteria group bacterium]|nr:hypothetical protein [Parcubacteria group bacterium]
MTHQEIRRKFIEFFEKRGHKIVPSSSLIPDDQSVLFTTAGMQQFKKYYTNPEMAPARNIVSIQKCMRTSDIDAIGDESHLTFFEMLGNFSFGGYGKEEAIRYACDFITKEMGLKIDYVTVFEGWKSTGLWIIKPDEESKAVWKKLGFKDEQIRTGGFEDNFWGPTGEDGPCGPTTEIYVNGVEIWNIVFNEYYKSKYPENNNDYKPLQTKGIDTGMGLERLAMVIQQKKNIFETDLFELLISVLPTADTNIKRKRIIADHARASFFLISDGVRPSNKDRGYILRRLMRRMTVQAHLENFGSFSGIDTLSLGITEDIKRVFSKIYDNYRDTYRELNLGAVKEVFDQEFNQFNKTFRQGLKEIKFTDNIDASAAFNLYGTFGMTFEIIKDVGGEKAQSLTREDFENEIKKHQEKSRVSLEKKFKK